VSPTTSKPQCKVRAQHASPTTSKPQCKLHPTSVPHCYLYQRASESARAPSLLFVCQAASSSSHHRKDEPCNKSSHHDDLIAVLYVCQVAGEQVARVGELVFDAVGDGSESRDEVRHRHQVAGVVTDGAVREAPGKENNQGTSGIVLDDSTFPGKLVLTGSTCEGPSTTQV
jgi:hypothetical protein